MTMPDNAFRLVRRTELIAQAAAVVGGDAGAPPAVILVGQAGIGKSALLRHTVTSAGGRCTVLHVVADASTCYGSVIELLWPIRDHAVAVPLAMRALLADLFDGDPSAARPPGPLAQAVQALVKAAAATTPILLAVDDLDRLDDGAAELLITVASTLAGSRVRAVMTARRRDGFNGVDRAIATITVPPLSADASAELMSLQPLQPDPGVRGEIIRWSRGNPLALIEYTRAYGFTGTRVFHGATMTESGSAHHPVFTNQIMALPGNTRTLLRYAAAGTGYESIDMLTEAAGLGGDLSEWEPARAAEIVHVTDQRHVVFANALLRSAAYATGDLGCQRAAHRALAALDGLKPSLRAWHLAAAATGPDETIAAELERSAIESHCRGMEFELARALQRAAGLSPDRADAARRYALAACAANFGGDQGWAWALSDEPYHDADDPDIAGHAALTRASILLQSSRPADAVDLIRHTLDGRRPKDAHLVLALMHAAGGASYYSGRVQDRRVLRRWLDEFGATPVADSPLPLPLPAAAADVQRAYIAMYADSASGDSESPRPVDRRWFEPTPSPVEPFRKLVAGVMAYSTEETATAAYELTSAMEQLTAAGGMRGFTFALAPLCWTLLDTGRWSELDHLLAQAGDICAVQTLTLVDREINACTAQLLAYRGDVDGVSAALVRARRITPAAAAPPRATEVALSRAAGWAAVAAGDFDEAYRLFSNMFSGAATPMHFVVSPRGIAELAWAAARSGRADQARILVSTIGSRLGTKPAARLRLLHHQALAVCTDGHLAERHHRLSVYDPAGEEWPIERARARLHYAEWLRRNRRPAEARPLLSAALEVFERVGAAPLAEITRSELRASGVTTAVPAEPDALQALTAQEQQIVKLAASGLTNREIAERLKLSPRTVASHLYHVYPKLGVSRRHELREFTS